MRNLEQRAATNKNLMKLTDLGKPSKKMPKTRRQGKENMRKFFRRINLTTKTGNDPRIDM